MKLFRRLFACLMATALASCWFPIYAQEHAPLITHLMVNEGRNGLLTNAQLFLIDDSLYVLTQEGIYLWRPSQASTIRLGDDLWQNGPQKRGTFVFSQSGDTFAIDSAKRRIYRVIGTDGILASADEWDFPLASEDGRLTPAFDIKGAVWDEAHLWLLVYATDTEDNELWHFTAGDDHLARESTPDMLGISAYRDNKFLVVQKNEDTSLSLLLWDAESGKKAELTNLGGSSTFFNHFPMHYQLSKNQLFYSSKNTICRKSLDNWETEGFEILGEPQSITMVKDRFLAVLSESGLSICDLDSPQAQKAVLRVAGTLPPEILNHVKALMPDVNVEVINEWDAKRTQEALVLRDASIDLFVLTTQSDMIGEIIRKNYLVAFDKESDMHRFLLGTYPSIRGVVTHEGAAYLLPLSMNATVFAYQPEAFKDLGLVAPLNFNAYLDALSTWMNTLSDEYPEYGFGQRESLRKELLLLGYDVFVNGQRKQGNSLRFDNPDFRKMMTRIESFDRSRLESMSALSEEDRETFAGFEVLPLTDTNWSYQPEQEHERYSLSNSWEPIPFGMDESSAPAMAADLVVIGVSAFSRNYDIAFRFVEGCYMALSSTFKAMLLPSETGAIANPQYSMEVERFTAVIAALKIDIERAKSQGKNISGYEQDLAYFQSLLENSERTTKYLLTTYEIGKVREKMNAVFFLTDLQRAENMGNIRELFGSYIDGAITLEMFISNADGILRLVQSEGK